MHHRAGCRIPHPVTGLVVKDFVVGFPHHHKMIMHEIQGLAFRVGDGAKVVKRYSLLIRAVFAPVWFRHDIHPPVAALDAHNKLLL